jgi:phosphoglycolate phosphatase
MSAGAWKGPAARVSCAILPRAGGIPLEPEAAPDKVRAPMPTDVHLIFDLDGTLTDPREGITRCYVHALEQLGLTPPAAESLERYIGPSIREVLAELLATTDAARIEEAVTIYRERFARVGLFENFPFPDVHATLRAFTETGYVLWVCTSKPRVYAERILEHFELAAHFRGVYGCELDGTLSDKAELLAHLLERETIVPATAIMIGDRKHDMRAARLNGTHCIGVTYGFGDLLELEEAGASAFCAQFSELPEAIAGILAAQ